MSERSLRAAVVAGVACGALGVAIGVAVSRSSPSPRAASMPLPATAVPAPGPIVVAGPTTARLDPEDRAALRAMIREELAAERGAADAGAPRDDDRAAPPLTDDQVRGFDRARAAVDQGLARGAWSDDDRAALREALSTLPPTTRIEIVRPLLVAVNAGKVRFEGRGPLF